TGVGSDGRTCNLSRLKLTTRRSLSDEVSSLSGMIKVYHVVCRQSTGADEPFHLDRQMASISGSMFARYCWPMRFRCRPSQAEDITVGSLKISGPWIRATPRTGRRRIYDS